MGGIFFPSSIFIFENSTKSCVKLNTLEPFEDQDLPVNELSGSEEEETVTVVLEEAKEKWDCESICSKYLSVHFAVKSMIVILKYRVHQLFGKVHICENDFEKISIIEL